MEYILLLLTEILIGLVLSRKLPQKYKWCGNCYWLFLGVTVAQLFVAAPFRLHRIVYDLSHLLG